MTTSEFIAKARKIDTMLAEEWSKVHEANNVSYSINRQIESNNTMIAFYQSNLSRHANKAERILKLEARNEDLQEKLEVQKLVVTEMTDKVVALDKELYEGWSRFFLVKHIHRSMYCSSFRSTTRVGWLPNVSGLTEAEAVAEHGETLCTICYPSAPTELTQKQADPAICTGTLDRSQPYELQRMSKWGTCSDCGERVSASKLGNLRKHKK